MTEPIVVDMVIEKEMKMGRPKHKKDKKMKKAAAEDNKN